MSYERFRSEFAASLLNNRPTDDVNSVLYALDLVAKSYNFVRQSTDLITVSEEPELVKVYLASLAVENKAIGTIKDYRRILKRFFKTVNKPFNTITTVDIRNYMFYYQRDNNLKKSSIDHIRTVINAFYSWLVNQEIIERNPAKHIEPIRYDKTGRDPIPKIVLEWIREACIKPREKALVDFLYSTGCRISECTALTINDIDWATRSVKIRHGKGDKARTTYFNEESEVSLKKYLSSKGHETEALFSSSRYPYGKVSKEALEAEIRRVRSRVPNLPVQVVPHAFRDTFATTLAQNGMPIEQVQKLLGHTSISTTMRYVRVSQNDAKINHSKFIA